MTQTIDMATWTYVAVQNPGGQEKIVGQHDAEQNIAFIPAFRDRDAALKGVTYLVLEPGQPIEVQAIIFEDLVRHAADGGFLIFVMDGQGGIMDRFTPDGMPL